MGETKNSVGIRIAAHRNIKTRLEEERQTKVILFHIL